MCPLKREMWPPPPPPQLAPSIAQRHQVALALRLRPQTAGGHQACVSGGAIRPPCSIKSNGYTEDTSTVIMLILLAGIFLLHLTTVILLLIATIDNAWWITDTMSTDVWGRWVNVGGQWNYTEIPNTNLQDYLHAVQASAVLSCIFSILGLFVFVAQLFTLGKGQRFTFSGVFQLISCLCVMIAASIYADIFHKGEKDGQYGHSFTLAWISFVFSFISSVIYFVLRKKTE
ncbi:hypothetical protein AAFF_G00260800 [Aldrovandia affinis]|uniref:Epithelial membrane protein 1 n=1 Tax=Aldrovandia affinis TaxID=143900 RepID=A0AAD7RC48_9TELE|nr:hypothetical protein AAFF_G00260800 [Aldrovandia affinis]